MFLTLYFCFFGAFVGARVYYVIFHNLNPETVNKYNFITTFTEIRDGGLAIYGGIIGAFLVGTIVALIKRMKILPLYDIAGVGILLGQAIGRWGNFINQEAYGAPTAGDLPWGMTGTIISKEVGNEVLVHPCFLYESLWCLIGFIALYFYSKKLRSFDGEMILLYIFWYGMGRGWIEGLRTDSLYWGQFRVSQVLAIASAILALALFIFFKIKFSRDENYLMYCDTEECKKKLAEYEEKIRLEKEGEKAPSILAEEIVDDESDALGENDDNNKESVIDKEALDEISSDEPLGDTDSENLNQEENNGENN